MGLGRARLWWTDGRSSMGVYMLGAHAVAVQIRSYVMYSYQTVYSHDGEMGCQVLRYVNECTMLT